MPSDPSKPSSSSSKPSSSSSSSSAKPSSSSSSSKPSSSSSSSSSSKPAPTSGDAKPPQPTPVISANAWMSFFLFVCLVLIILQAPLGLNTFGGTSTIFGLPAAPWGANGGLFPALGGLGGMPGCGGVVAGYVPWCHGPGVPGGMPGPLMAYAQPQPQVVYATAPPQQGPIIIEQPPRQYVQPRRDHQMGGQGQIATPGGGAGWSWYANNDGNEGEYRRVRQERQDGRYTQVQYQRPGVQVQVTQGRGQPGYPQYQEQAHSSPPPHSSEGYYASQSQGQPPQMAVPAPVQPVVGLPPAAAVGMANLENAFYPLLIGAIALLVIFDYAS